MNVKRTAAVAIAALSVAGAAIVTSSSPAAAHGTSLVAGSRTYLCYVDGLTDTGEIKPDNPACADAVAQGGTQPLYDWFGVLRSDAAGRTAGYVPDGEICGGGTEKYRAYNAARADWPVTHLSAGATIEWRHGNWAHHPGRFDMYITPEGWDPTQPLGWGDLERFASVTDPPQSGPPGGFHYYSWDVQLPERTGQHVIFVHWIRSDSAENFYGCSDVVFDGGNGEVSGISVDREDVAEPLGPTMSAPPAGPPASTAATPPTSAAPPAGEPAPPSPGGNGAPMAPPARPIVEEPDYTG